MEQVLEQVHGKLFRYCGMPSKKLIRLVCHSFALDIDVFTGLSVIIDDRSESSLDLARNVKTCKLTIRNITRMNNNARDNYIMWLYSPLQFPSVYRVSLDGFVQLTWILDCLTNFDNLTSLFIGGLALNCKIFNSRIPLTFHGLEILEISSLNATSNILHVSNEGGDDVEGDEEESDKGQGTALETQRYGMKSDLLDIERGLSSDSTPVADNIYHILCSISSPKLHYFRLTYDEDLYNMGSLNWKNNPLTGFLRRHSQTLRHLTLDGEQNDQESFRRPRGALQPLPSKLHHIFVSVVDRYCQHSGETMSIPLMKNVRRLGGDHESLWKRLLRKQTQLESLHCTIDASWAWMCLSKAIKRSCQFLQVINIGCPWPDLQSPMNMDLIGECLFLKKLTFGVISPVPPDPMDEVWEERNRCRIKNLPSLLTCIFLESIFISSALCETSDLDILTQLPNLTSLVLMYVGKMTRYGVNIGILQDFLSLRSLNLLVIVEFRRQKHSMDSYRLKKILGSDVNNQNCPIIHHLVPYSGFGKFVYVGDITELTLSGQVDASP
ncbi:unnamed protein product [Allacma fusca]|uniref:Uncharacterized protein n=1 Tax=Allacma fusca TaxID=39272 RepID=A0A8J2MES2_9HEXA|nr:unnamed protein product [Allacma fusca]